MNAIPNVILALLLGTTVGAIIYLGTRLVVGQRAEKLFGGALGVVFFVSPWWAALIGAVLGHVLAVIALRKLTKQPISPKAKNLVLGLLFVYGCGLQFHSHTLVNEAQQIAQKNLTSEWAKFSEQGEAHKFAMIKYKSCIDDQPFFSSIKSTYEVCQLKTVKLADNFQGPTFAKEVDNTIEKWNKRVSHSALDSQLKQVLSSLVS